MKPASGPLSPALEQLVKIVARIAVDDYLREVAEQREQSTSPRPGQDDEVKVAHG